MLSRRQIIVQRENLASMCRISVKALLDYACLYTHVNDDSEEFINFCAVFEQLVSHRLRPYQKKVWLPGQGSPRHFWDVLLDNHNRTRGFLFPTCIPNIEAIETIKSPKAKLRAFIRVALMEKRLSDYMYWLLGNKYLIHESYLDGALLASEEANLLCGELMGLNAIDFNFCLKGNENELLGPLEISYRPFLVYMQSSASQCSDEIEMLRLSGKDVDEAKHTGAILTESNVNDMLRLQNLEKDMRHLKEQKDYLEELLRLRERQLTEANIRIKNMTIEWQLAERSREKERETMEACILELQNELTKSQKSNDSLKAQVTAQKYHRHRIDMREVMMVEVAMDGGREVSTDGVERVNDRHHIPRTGITKEPSLSLSDQSKRPSVSDHAQLKENAQTSVPVTGGLGSVSASTLDSHAEEHVADEIVSGTQADLQSEFTAFNVNVKDTAAKETPQDQDEQSASHTKGYGMETSTSKAEDDNAVGLAHSSETDQLGHQDGHEIKNNEMSITMAESYVVTEKADISDPLPSQLLAKSADASGLAVDSVAAGSFGPLGGEHSMPGLSDGSSSNADSEKEEGVMSEPEIINAGHVSSDSGDAAWEVLSSSDHIDHRSKM